MVSVMQVSKCNSFEYTVYLKSGCMDSNPEDVEQVV